MDAVNAATEERQLDALLHEYFRPALGSKRRRRDAADEPARATPESALAALKRFLRDHKDPRHVQRAFDAVSGQLSSAKRQRALLPRVVALAGELFARSAAFRSLVAAQAAAFFTKLLEAAGEKDVAVARPRGSRKRQSDDVETVLAMVEAWKDEFGARYPTIVAGHAGLVDVGYVFPRRKDRAADAQAQQVERIRHQTSVREVQLKKMRREMETLVPEMETTITAMESIFEILIPTLEAFEVDEPPQEAPSIAGGKSPAGEQSNEHDDDDGVLWDSVPTKDLDLSHVDSAADGGDDEEDVEWEDVGGDETAHDSHDEETSSVDDAPHEDMDINEIVQAYGLGSSSYQLTISIPTHLCAKSSENEVLFRNLSDHVLEIRKRFLPLVGDWQQIADRDAAALGARPDASLLRRLAQLRGRLEGATLKWADLVRESERKRVARVQPRVVSLPLAAFDASSSSAARQMGTHGGGPVDSRRAVG